MAGPPLECDIVMKGGITSGVVYPGAVVRLSGRYRFRSIGGASAGALAAVAAAAAEYGREREGGFDRLAEIPAELASTVDGKPFILTLFQPQKETAPLFRSALALQRFGRTRAVLAVLRNFWVYPLLALAIALLAVACAARGYVPWWLAVAVLGLTPWILVLGVAGELMRAVGKLPANDFGLCRLGPGSEKRALTEWLHGVIQHLSGRAQSRDAPAGLPLTFADLWGAPPLRGDETEEELEARRELLRGPSWDAAQRAIDLQVITTNLTLGRPLRLPIAGDRWRPTSSDGGLLFDPGEWGRFFPRDVVEHMRRVAARPNDDDLELIELQQPGLELLELPRADLPIVVAARMSLSFPVLVSTVPMWQIQRRAGGDHRLRRVVFSDGGISSNFPVHFFDAALPTRPTFALNLASFDREESPNLDDPRECVADPAKVTGLAREGWKEPATMFGFAIAIKDAMQNWRDNVQARMPGFRERVIHIKLARHEGGLNLAMDDRKVSRLVERGEFAAGQLIELFSGPEDGAPVRTEHWNDHRFARFRIVMSSVERFFRDVKRTYEEPPDAVSIPYDERIEAGLDVPYPLTQAQLQAAQTALARWVELGGAAETLDDDNAPRPRAVTRITSPL